MSLVASRSILLKGFSIGFCGCGGTFHSLAPILAKTRQTPSRRQRVKSRTFAVAETGARDASSTDTQINWQAYDAQQRTAARLSHAEQARLLLDTGRHGVLSTTGSFGAWTGFPVGTVVEYAMDDAGRPVFAFSSLSSHTPDIKADPRCSLTVTAPGYKGMSDARVTLSGRLSLLGNEDVAEAKKIFLLKNPGSFWVDFGDFSWFRMDDIVTGRLVGGFGRIKQISSEEYKSTSKDPVAAFAEPIASHMNADHADSIVAMVKHYVGIAVDVAKIEGLDRVGMDLQCRSGKESFSCRLPFIRTAESRKDVKEIIVEMTKTAAAAR